VSGGRGGFFELAAELLARREPFATATVVRAERPTSAKPGAKAIVTGDGRLVGWIGGSCAAPVVIREALGAIADGETRLIEISKTRAAPRPGVRHFPMTCHSGGTLEIHIEPLLPTEQLVIVGRTPLARALAALGSALGRHVVVAEPDVTTEDFPTAGTIVPELSGARVDERTAIVIASRGDADEDPVEAALATPAWYVGLVASPTRAAVIRDVLGRRGVSRERIERLSSPAGLDIGAKTDEEIALTILAQMLSYRHAREAMAAAAAETHRNFQPMPAAREAIDPICGMTVAITAAALRAEHGGATYYFCGEGCRRRFLADPVAAIASSR
jgi:xanthine dehydrogenase accessory factor